MGSAPTASRFDAEEEETTEGEAFEAVEEEADGELINAVLEWLLRNA